MIDDVIRVLVVLAVCLVPLAKQWWREQVRRGREIKLASDLLDADPAYDVISRESVLRDLPEWMRGKFR